MCFVSYHSYHQNRFVNVLSPSRMATVSIIQLPAVYEQPEGRARDKHNHFFFLADSITSGSSVPL